MKEELETIQKLYNVLIEFIVNYSFQIIGALIIFLLGLFISKKIAEIIEKICNKNNLDVTLTKFIVNIVKFTILIGVSIIALGKIGITLTPFIAGIGAASLGAGLALQGMLSNYGAGLGIIITRPFIVGNTITIEGISGVVEEIRLGYTILETEDGEKITIPNKHIVGEVLVNSFEYKVVENMVGIGYLDDPKKAIEIIENILYSFKEIGLEPKAQVGIKEFGDFSINIELRYWAPTKSYFETQYKVNMAIFEGFKKNHINIPYPTYNIIKSM